MMLRLYIVGVEQEVIWFGEIAPSRRCATLGRRGSLGRPASEPEISSFLLLNAFPWGLVQSGRVASSGDLSFFQENSPTHRGRFPSKASSIGHEAQNPGRDC